MTIERIPFYLLPKRDPGAFPAGRLCDRCSALLSRNNPSTVCHPCQLQAMPAEERDNVVMLHPDEAA